jgi:hypothetical protein
MPDFIKADVGSKPGLLDELAEIHVCDVPPRRHQPGRSPPNLYRHPTSVGAGLWGHVSPRPSRRRRNDHAATDFDSILLRTGGLQQPPELMARCLDPQNHTLVRLFDSPDFEPWLLDVAVSVRTLRSHSPRRASAQIDAPSLTTSAIRSSSCCGAIGLVTWRIKPAASARSRSSGRPYPVRAMRRGGTPPAARIRWATS